MLRLDLVVAEHDGGFWTEKLWEQIYDLHRRSQQRDQGERKQARGERQPEAVDLGQMINDQDLI